MILPNLSSEGIETIYVGVRWTKVTCSATLATAGKAVTAVAPDPIMATFLSKIILSCCSGIHFWVWIISPGKFSCPIKKCLKNEQFL